MTQPKRDENDPLEWLRRAKSNLIQAKIRAEGVYLEDLCFNAQQAVEKAVKGLLKKYGLTFPLTHDLVRLNTELQKAIKHVPPELEKAEFLSAYSVGARYPNAGFPITEEEYRLVIEAAEWAVEYVGKQLSDLNKLQGRWKQVGYERDGIVNPIDEEKGWHPITEITDSKFKVEISSGNTILEGIFRLDETSTPKAIDWIDVSGSYASQHPILAIYELTDTDFVFCAAYDGSKRPTEFETKAGLVLRRMKRL